MESRKGNFVETENRNQLPETGGSGESEMRREVKRYKVTVSQEIRPEALPQPGEYN